MLVLCYSVHCGGQGKPGMLSCEGNQRENVWKLRPLEAPLPGPMLPKLGPKENYAEKDCMETLREEQFHCTFTFNFGEQLVPETTR